MSGGGANQTRGVLPLHLCPKTFDFQKYDSFGTKKSAQGIVLAAAAVGTAGYFFYSNKNHFPAAHAEAARVLWVEPKVRGNLHRPLSLKCLNSHVSGPQ